MEVAYGWGFQWTTSEDTFQEMFMPGEHENSCPTENSRIDARTKKRLALLIFSWGLDILNFYLWALSQADV